MHFFDREGRKKFTAQATDDLLYKRFSSAVSDSTTLTGLLTHYAQTQSGPRMFYAARCGFSVLNGLSPATCTGKRQCPRPNP